MIQVGGFVYFFVPGLYIKKKNYRGVYILCFGTI